MPDLAALMIRPEEVASYIVFTDGVNVYAKNGLTGAIEYSNPGDAGDVINYCVSKLPANGGKIFIRAGTYSVKTPVTINRNGVMIEGEQLGYGDQPGTKLVLDGYFHMFTVIGCFFAYFRNLYLHGNDQARSAINISDANDVTVERCFLHHFGYPFIQALSPIHVLRITDNWIEVGDGWGVWIGGSSTVDTVFIHNNYFLSVKNAVALTSYPSAIFGVVISNNIIRLTKEHGILIQKGAMVIVEGNAVYDCGSSAANTYSGIRLENATGVLVKGNTIINYATSYMKYAVEETGTADYNLIVDNIVKSATSPAIVKVGANTVTANNVVLA
jgi:hypothetical protein